MHKISSSAVKEILQTLQAIKGKYKPNPKQFSEDLRDEKAEFHGLATKVRAAIDDKNYAVSALRKLAIAKVENTVALDVSGQKFSDLDPQGKRYVLTCLLGDDWGTVLRTIAPPVLNHLWGKIKDTGIYRKAKKLLSDQLGLDLNDDNAGYLGNPFSTNLSIKKNLRWDDFSEDYMNISRGYDGVSA